jgi:hypothetical protein
MRRNTIAPLILPLLGLGCDARAISTASASTEVSADPVLVELFTSEGCSSCPAADERLSALDHTGVAGVPVIVLAMHVDYWDDLGWKDTFGSPAWSARQVDYSRSIGRGGLFTPEAVVDGADEFVGSDDHAAAYTVRRAARHQKAKLMLARAGATTGEELALAVTVSQMTATAPGDSVEVLAAITEEHIVDPVARGENAGRRLALAPVVLSLDSLGLASDGATVTRTVHLPPHAGARALRVVAFLQERTSRHVLGAASEPLARF